MNPFLLDIPLRFETQRLVLRCPQAGDGPALNSAVAESLDELRPWFGWADHPHTLEESETFVREAYIRYLRRTALDWLIFLKNTSVLVGAIGLWNIDWAVPCFQMPYWLRTAYTGHGYATEAADGVVAFAFNNLGARRITIAIDARNTRSIAVAQRLGFVHEGTFRCEVRDHNTGELIDYVYFAKVRADDDNKEPPFSMGLATGTTDRNP